MVISFVTNLEMFEIVVIHEEHQQLVSLVVWSYGRGGIGISTDINYRVGILLTNGLNSAAVV